MPEVKRGRERKKEKVLSRGPTSFPSRTLLQASTSPCRSPHHHHYQKTASIKELWRRLEKAWADFQWDFRRRHKGQKSFAFVCRSNRSDEPRAGGSACHRGPDLLWELISIIWGELYRLRVYSCLGEQDKEPNELRPTYCTKKSLEKQKRRLLGVRKKRTKANKTKIC